MSVIFPGKHTSNNTECKERPEKFDQNHLDICRYVRKRIDQAILTNALSYIAIFPAVTWPDAFRDLTLKYTAVCVWLLGGIVLAFRGALLFYSQAAGLVVIPMH